jgi:glycine cleavage system H protein
MIVQSPETASTERCSTPSFSECPCARHAGDLLPEAPSCPFLEVSLMQYCTAAPIIKYIPYSESLLSRCGSDNYHYCELFLELADTARTARRTAAEVEVEVEEGSASERSIEGVMVSSNIAYTSNHMWLDVGEDGSCHVGVDAFFAKVLGRVDKFRFVATRPGVRPSAVIHSRGVDFLMTFPGTFQVTRTNHYLRADPGKMISHPYSLGWLFEGKADIDWPARKQEWGSALILGKAAFAWMQAEIDRISQFIHDRYTVRADEPLMMDGGTFRPGFVQHLEREDVFALFQEFFAFHTQ